MTLDLLGLGRRRRPSSAIDASDPASDRSHEPEPNGGRVNFGAFGNTVEAIRSPGSDLIFRDGFEG